MKARFFHPCGTGMTASLMMAFPFGWVWFRLGSAASLRHGAKSASAARIRSHSMQLQLSTWPQVEAYLARSKAILIPIGSTEQHGPNGLLGTDALCPEIISRRAGDDAGFLVGPT